MTRKGLRACGCIALFPWLAASTAALAGVCTAPAAAGGPEPHLPRIEGVIRVDGLLDEAVWSQALRFRLETETSPGENVAAPVATEALVAENGSALLVAFRASDPRPAKIRAFYRDRDRAYDDDFVGIVLDTFNDERLAFEFFANPFGAQMDLTQDDVNNNEDDSWDAIWDSAGRITEDGYQVEMSIPLQQLRFPRVEGYQTWGIDLVRFYPRSQRHRLSMNALDRGRECYLCQLTKVRGFACAEPGRNLVVAPTLTANRSAVRDDPRTDPLVSAGTDFEPGLDVRWGITPDLTLSATLNPDFSQVEADVAQLSVNEQFALFFPEKRPFFLEGADFFSTPTDLVFTRNVAAPDAGLKLIGKQGHHSYGLFAARDAVTNLLFPGAEGSDTERLAAASNVLVGRYRRDIGRNSALGVLLTARQGDDYHNILAGIDGHIGVTASDTIRFQYVATDTAYPAAIAAANDQPRELDDDAYRLIYDHRSRNWRGWFRYEGFGRDFRADMGFIPRVDFDRVIAGARRLWFPQGGFHEIGIGGDWDISHTGNGEVLERELEANMYLAGPMQSTIEIGGGLRDRLFDGVLFKEVFGFFYGEFQPAAGVEIELFTRFGEQIDFANTRLGDLLLIEPELQLSLGKHLGVDLRHTYQRLDEQGSGINIFTANLSDIRLTWQFSTRSFVRLTVQHEDIERRQSLYRDEVDARSRGLGTQLLYSYKVNPQTVLFLGYSDAAEDGDLLGEFVRTDRTLFAKVGYAWLPR